LAGDSERGVNLKELRGHARMLQLLEPADFRSMDSQAAKAALALRSILPAAIDTLERTDLNRLLERERDVAKREQEVQEKEQVVSTFHYLEQRAEKLQGEVAELRLYLGLRSVRLTLAAQRWFRRVVPA